MRRKIVLLFSFLVIALSAMCQTPTKQEFLKACDSLKIHNPNVVWAQACLESGNFTSAHYRNRNNCLGIYDSKRKRYASFDSWQHCLAAYKSRFQYRCKRTDYTDLEYLDWVCQNGYAKDPTYKSKVKKHM